MDKPLYIDLPEELYSKLREHCFKTERTKKEVVVGALEKFLEDRPQGKDVRS